MAATRTPEEIRRSIEANRAELGMAVERLRAEVAEATDWRTQINRHRQQALIGAAVAGFVLGGGIAALTHIWLTGGRCRGSELARRDHASWPADVSHRHRAGPSHRLRPLDGDLDCSAAAPRRRRTPADTRLSASARRGSSRSARLGGGESRPVGPGGVGGAGGGDDAVGQRLLPEAVVLGDRDLDRGRDRDGEQRADDAEQRGAEQHRRRGRRRGAPAAPAPGCAAGSRCSPPAGRRPTR